MYGASFLSSILMLSCVSTCYPLIFAAASDVSETNEALHRYMADTPKHVVETEDEHRKKEIAGFLKTGKMPSLSEKVPKSSFKKDVISKMQKVPTEVLMKQYLDGGNHIKGHLDAESRGRGPDKSDPPSLGPVTNGGKGNRPYPPPTKLPKGKMTKGTMAPKATKEPKEPKKDKKSKDGKKGYSSDFPSTSPTPSSPIGNDVVLSPSSNVDINTEEEKNGRSSSGSKGTDVTIHESDVTESPSDSSSVTKIVSPIAAFAGLLLIGGIWLSRRRRPNVTLDKNENLMKHTREGFDVEDGTVSGNTYRTGAFTEDDGTLEESVDVMQETVKNKISQRFDRELEKVMNELEEVSLQDEGASTISVSSRSYSPTNSCDEHLLESVRAAMTSDAFKPRKSNLHDSSIKPEWTSRSLIPSNIEPANELLDTYMTKVEFTSHSSTEAISLNQEHSYKKYISSSPRLVNENVGKHDNKDIQVETTSIVVTQSNDLTTPASEESNACESTSQVMSSESMVSPSVSGTDGTETTKPEFTKAQLRPVTSRLAVPNVDVFAKSPSVDNSEPEWMRKFKQMGLEKKE